MPKVKLHLLTALRIMCCAAGYAIPFPNAADMTHINLYPPYPFYYLHMTSAVCRLLLLLLITQRVELNAPGKRDKTNCTHTHTHTQAKALKGQRIRQLLVTID